jgi:hypothetical protein
MEHLVHGQTQDFVLRGGFEFLKSVSFFLNNFEGLGTIWGFLVQRKLIFIKVADLPLYMFVDGVSNEGESTYFVEVYSWPEISYPQIIYSRVVGYVHSGM